MRSASACGLARIRDLGQGPVPLRGISDEDRQALGMWRCSDCEHSDGDGVCEVWRAWLALDSPACNFFAPHFR